MTTGGTFGVGSTSGWGDAEVVGGEPSGEEAPRGSLQGGHSLEVDEVLWKALLHHPLVVEAITARAIDIADAANSMIAMDPRAVARISAREPGKPAYDVSVQNLPETKRARARAYTATLLGIIDEAHHQTLEKAMHVGHSGKAPVTVPTESDLEAQADIEPTAEEEATLEAILGEAGGGARDVL